MMDNWVNVELNVGLVFATLPTIQTYSHAGPWLNVTDFFGYLKTLFNCIVSVPYKIVVWLQMINRKGFGRKQLWPIVIFDPLHLPQEMKERQWNPSVRIRGFWATIQTQNGLNKPTCLLIQDE